MSAATDRRDIGDDDFRDKIRQFAQEARARGKSEPVTRTPLRLLSVDDALNAPPREYILDDLLAERELSVWWGRPKCGKSFLMLRLAYGLALGEGMWGKKVRKPVLVIYVAAEGEGGVKGRIRALADAMGKAPHFRFIAQRVDLLAPNADVGPLITMIQDLLKTLTSAGNEEPAVVIVVDTYHRSCPGGEENSSRDAGLFLSNMDRLREETGAHVAAVHHGGVTGERMRGSTAIEGGADLVMKIEKTEGGRTATIEMAKDDEDGLRLPFNLKQVEIGVDAHGRTRTTLLAEEAEGGPAAEPEQRLPPAAQAVRICLADLINTEGKLLPKGGLFPTGLLGVPETRLYQECDTRRVSTAANQAVRDKAIRREVRRLREKSVLAMRDGLVWLTDQKRKP